MSYVTFNSFETFRCHKKVWPMLNDQGYLLMNWTELKKNSDRLNERILFNMEK